MNPIVAGKGSLKFFFPDLTIGLKGERGFYFGKGSLKFFFPDLTIGLKGERGFYFMGVLRINPNHNSELLFFPYIYMGFLL